MRQILAGGNRSGQGGDHRIAGTGYIEYFTSPGRQVQRRMIRAQQGHAVLATGHQQRTEVQLLHELRALGNQLMLVEATADDGFEFTEVGRDQAGSAIDREILALRIGKHRNTSPTRRLNQRLMVFQRPLAVIGKHQHLDAVEQAIHFNSQRQGVGGKGLLEINAQQLLVTAHDPQLDDGRLVRNTLEQRPDPYALEAVDQAVGGLIITGNAHQGRRGAQRGNVEGNVGGAARTVFDLLDLDHRHRRLRGNP